MQSSWHTELYPPTFSASSTTILDDQCHLGTDEGDTPPLTSLPGYRSPPQKLSSPARLIWAEMLSGLELLPGGKRRDVLLREPEVTFNKDFAGRILRLWRRGGGAFASFMATPQLQGRAQRVADARIAAVIETASRTVCWKRRPTIASRMTSSRSSDGSAFTRGSSARGSVPVR
jgi:hypothetical protein